MPRKTDTAPRAPHPYRELFIYYIQGHLPVDHGIFGPGFIGNWIEDDCSFLFFTRPAGDIVEKVLAGYPGVSLIDSYQMSYTQWHGGEIRRRRLGRFEIFPPWSDRGSGAACDDGTIEMVIDPGVVFGTGMHPTTRDCLEALEILSDRHRVTSALDLGCGTGMLGIAAAKLGCPRVIAVDNHWIAVAATRRNIGLNGLEKQVLAVVGDAENFIDLPGDLVVTNIHYHVMKQLIKSKTFLRHRWFILSGLLRSEAAEVKRILDSYPVVLHRTWDSDGTWHTFLGETLGQNDATAVMKG